MTTSWRSRLRWASKGASGACLGALLAVSGPASAQQAPVAGSIPVFLDIPSIGTHAPIIALGQDDDGTLQAPTDPDTVGWYAPGAGIGTPGNALLDGHVDWAGRLRVFGLLKQLQPGDEIKITDAVGDVLTYTVAWTQLFDAKLAPVDQIFEQSSAEAEEVTLITCGGAFDPSLHMYLSRWVVRATRISAY